MSTREPSSGDLAAMRAALRQARAGLGATYPNPCVGAVVLAGDELVGDGWHHAWGEPHAEVEALAKPSVVAWAINQIARQRRDLVTDLIAAVDRVRAVHQGDQAR